uniref:tumor necrosis factor receptor superfamily member 6-like n=1 Tax=Monopterus albus TaxID=43700 RepID=UPI0009B31218
MASESTRFTALCVISLASIFYLLSPAHGASSSQLEGKSHGHSLKGVFRSKRESVCIDGEYEHEGNPCCLCGAGQSLVWHCSSKSRDDRVCQPCKSGTYRSTPNYETTCEVCTSCDKLNENKEVAERCTPAKNTKCKCKKGHYCETEICVVCHPCKQ